MPFPTPSATILTFPEQPEDRLRRALRALDAALDNQAMAVACLRRELRALSGAVEDLGDSLQGYAGGLRGTQAALARAGTQARRLEATADIMLARSNG
jgi:hypothetical protein